MWQVAPLTPPPPPRFPRSCLLATDRLTVQICNCFRKSGPRKQPIVKVLFFYSVSKVQVSVQEQGRNVLFGPLMYIPNQRARHMNGDTSRGMRVRVTWCLSILSTSLHWVLQRCYKTEQCTMIHCSFHSEPLATDAVLRVKNCTMKCI